MIVGLWMLLMKLTITISWLLMNIALTISYNQFLVLNAEYFFTIIITDSSQGYLKMASLKRKNMVFTTPNA